MDKDFKDGGLRQDLEELLNAYRNREWSVVSRLLKRSKPEMAKYGIPAIETLYARRIRQFRRSPPPPNWDGVSDAVSK
jgi:hypothetical protein